MGQTSPCAMKKKKHFVCIVYFYSGLGERSIWFYLGLMLNSISYNFFEVLSLRQCTFNFRQNKNIFNWFTKFLSNVIYFLIRTFKNKMIQKSKSISINNHQHNDKKENVDNQLNFNCLTSNVKGLQSSRSCFKMFQYFKNKIGHRGILFL